MNRFVNSSFGVSFIAMLVILGIRTPLIAVDILVIYPLKLAPMLYTAVPTVPMAQPIMSLSVDQ